MAFGENCKQTPAGDRCLGAVVLVNGVPAAIVIGKLADSVTQTSHTPSPGVCALYSYICAYPMCTIEFRRLSLRWGRVAVYFVICAF